MMLEYKNRAVLFAYAVVLVAGTETRAFADRWSGSADDAEYGCCHQSEQQPAWTRREDAKAFDEATGRDLRNFPPDRIVDFMHMKLQMRFDDLNDQRFSAVETLTVMPIGIATASLKLDAVNLRISSAKLGDKPVEYWQDDETISFRFDPALPVAEKQELTIEYVCDHPYDGMTFTPSSPDAPNYTAEVHTQGQTDTNRHWFICHDFPNERMTTELIVDVPAGFSVSSNGKLVSNLTSGDRSIWHWLQDKPHTAYLVSLVIGKFDIVEIPHERVPMKVWVPLGKGDLVGQTYGRTGEMIDLFERRFGVPYPWARYDQICAKNFGAGGMENTSATTMYPTAILDQVALADGDLDGLISHELCHQWTGDMITCKSWEHIWLNEGWATYGSALWNEQRFGEDGYFDSIRGNFRVAQRDKSSNPLPMVSSIWKNPGETFGRAANPYPKGSSILHMLRMMLGEEVFWDGVKLYMNRHALGTVETNDFRYALEEVSGRGLEWFFEQWCYRPGCPELNAKLHYDGQSRELFVDVQQTQKIDERTPAMRFTLPVLARTATGAQVFNIDITEQSTSYRAALDGPPIVVEVDPRLHVLKTIVEDKPFGLWIEQARSGSTIASRHDAIEAIGKTDTPETIALLASLIRDEAERYTIRTSAVECLGEFASPEARETFLAILKESVNEPRVRAAMVEQLEKFDKGNVVDLLADIATDDTSYATKVAAIHALAHHKANQHADAIVALADFESQHDNVRSAALRALGELDDQRGLDLAIKYAAYGFVDRSRPAAIDVVGKLHKHDKDRAVTLLLSLLNDPESRSMNAAGRALAHIEDERAKEPIQAMAQTHRDPSIRERASEWLKQLEGQDEGTDNATTRPQERRRR